MFDSLVWYGVTMLLWGACWGFLCLFLCLGRLGRAPRQVARAALVCALRMGSTVSPPWRFWMGLLAFRPPAGWEDVFAFYYPVLSLLLMGVVVYGWRWVTPAEAGLRGWRPGSWRPVVLVVAIVAAAVVLNAYLTRESYPRLGWAGRLFYATMPGVGEEVFYRGVLLGLLGRVFARRLPLPGTRTSWGGVVSVVLFALAHGLKSQAYQMALMPSSNHHVSPQGWYYWLPLWHSSAADQLHYLAMGTLFLWVRERTGSSWAAAGTHCLMNTCLMIGAGIG